MTEIEKGSVYWLPENRTFIAAKIGTKQIHGLVVEADGLHALRIPKDTRLAPATFKGQPYPPAKMRGHLRRMKPATAGARKLRGELLQ